MCKFNHLKEVNEHYFEHLWQAASFSLKMIGAGIAGLIHAILPNVFTVTVSTTVAELYRTLAKRGRV